MPAQPLPARVTTEPMREDTAPLIFHEFGLQKLYLGDCIDWLRDAWIRTRFTRS